MTESEKITELETLLDEAKGLLEKWVYFNSTAEIKSPLRIETEQFFEEKSNGWHNIKDNSEDLPTEDGRYLVVEEQYGEKWYDTAYFIKDTGQFFQGEKIIAWHKIPEYMGEL